MKELSIFLGIMAVNPLIAYGLGWLATEWRRPLLPFKPFNCRPCFTFWACLIGATLSLHYLTPMPWVPSACIAFWPAFALFVHLKNQINIIND